MIEWEDLVLQTAERFGGNLPHPDTSAAIQRVHARAPHAVERAIDRITLEYEQGGVRSPWGILKSRVQQITTDTTSTTKANGRDKAISRAEQWIRNAGVHYDLASHVEDELYGERGILRDHPQTRDRMMELWDELRPLGIQAEHDLEARAAERVTRRAQLATRPGNIDTTEALT